MSTELAEQIALKLPHLPESPGVYLFMDREGRALYVGKAKSIRKRVGSHFSKSSVSGADV